MYRVLSMLLCVGVCSLTGIRLASRLRERAAALTDMRNGITALTGGIRHSNRPLEKIAQDIACSGGSEFWKRFSEKLAVGEDAETAWNDAMSDVSGRGGALHAMTARDRALLAPFAATLGRTGRSSQTESGRLTAEELTARIHEADGQYVQKGRIYRVLGVFLGLGLGILLL